MRIGILQCGHFATEPGYPEKTYHDLYADLLAGRGLTFRTWSVVDMEFPEGVNDAVTRLQAAVPDMLLWSWQDSSGAYFSCFSEDPPR